MNSQNSPASLEWNVIRPSNGSWVTDWLKIKAETVYSETKTSRGFSDIQVYGCEGKK